MSSGFPASDEHAPSVTAAGHQWQALVARCRSSQPVAAPRGREAGLVYKNVAKWAQPPPTQAVPSMSCDCRHLSTPAPAPALLPCPQDERRTPLATAFSSRPQSRAGSGYAAGLAGAAAAAAPLSALRASPPQPATVHPATQQQVAQGLLAAKESEAALLRQQLQQLTADFKFNLKVWWQGRSGVYLLAGRVGGWSTCCPWSVGWLLASTGARRGART